MMGKSMWEQAEQARREFPPGARIRLIRMVPPEPQPVEPGTMEPCDPSMTEQTSG